MFEPFINYLKLFREIPPADITLIEQALAYRELKEGDVLLQSGKIARELFFVCSGVLKILSTNEKGNDVTYFFLKENQFATILNSFNNEVPGNETIQAACDAAVIIITRERLLKLYKTIPYLKDLITGITQQGLINKINLKNSFLGEDAATRYQKFLLLQPEVALRVSLSDIASYLGITQQSLSRIRRNMK
ncbi:Crp/Fnr family transcriptional regulator [Chitinophagaceae bacterium LWZ2-11]